MSSLLPILKGHGAVHNPPNRFVKLHMEDDWEHFEGDAEGIEERRKVKTEYFVDTSRSILSTNDSPDLPFTHSLNSYRGCSHGCIYCYARPGHEYLDLSAGLDFETKIMVKPDAPQLLREALSSRQWTPTVISMSGVTDCYQPIERKMELTRGCLKVFADFRNPVGIVTKNHLVTRDIDLLQELTAVNAVAVYVSITTLDSNLTRIMEPRTSVPARRLAAVEALARAGIPVGVMMAPIVPGLTDHEIPAVLQAAADAGASCVSYTILRLPWAVAPLFESWLERHFPDRKEKVLNRIRSLRDGKLNDPNFGTRLRGQGIWADQIKTMFATARRKAGFDQRHMPVASTSSFRNASDKQMKLW